MECLNMIAHRQGDPLANRTIKSCLLPTFVTRNMRHSNKTQLLAEGDLTSDLRGKKSQLYSLQDSVRTSYSKSSP